MLLFSLSLNAQETLEAKLQHCEWLDRHIEINRIFVSAKLDRAWETARHFNAAEIPWIKMLFGIRTLPERLFDKNEEQGPISVGVDEVTKSGAGFVLLHKIPGKEVLVGSVGQFWQRPSVSNVFSLK